jgi:uncharacterized low-complexity protein
MTWIIVAAVSGLLVGGGAVFGFTHEKAGPVIVAPPDTTAKGQADAVAALTNLDVVKAVCDPAYIKERGDGLCREMYCLAQANSTTGAAGEKMCDAVSNVNNSLVIIDSCLKLEGQARLDCLTVFRERK